MLLLTWTARFITLLAGGVAWPFARGRSRQTEHGALACDGICETDPGAKALSQVHRGGFRSLAGSRAETCAWTVCWNWKDRSDAYIRKELVSLQLDVIVTQSTPVTAAVKRGTSTIPIGWRPSLRLAPDSLQACPARRERHGVGSRDKGSMASKWLELLTAIAPSVERAVMMQPDMAPTSNLSFFLIRGRCAITESRVSRGARP